MFQPLIGQARNMIQRLHAGAEQGRDGVPQAVNIRMSELEAWDTATQGIVHFAFGADAAEAARWHALAQRRATLVGEAVRKDMKRGEYFGLIDYFHLAIGVLTEFEAKYRHQLDAAAVMSRRTPEPPDHQALPDGQDRLARHAPQTAPNDQHRALQVAGERPELTIALTRETYEWLNGVVGSREPARLNDYSAIAQVAASIIERVARNMQRNGRQL